MPIPGSRTGCCLYIQPHKSRRCGGGAPGGAPRHVLFVANVPPRWAERRTKQLFSCFGEVGAVTVGALSRPRSGAPVHYARVSFATADGLRRACQQQPVRAVSVDPLPPPPPLVTQSLDTYERERPDHHSLQEEANGTMAAFERREAAHREAAAREAGSTDDDGFTMVGRSKGAKLVVGQAAAGRRANPRKRKKKTKELTNFYRWQLREQKKHELEDLRAGFQEDLKKIARMKRSKRFKVVE
jgi:ribosomal RNA-processing protein 7